MSVQQRATETLWDVALASGSSDGIAQLLTDTNGLTFGVNLSSDNGQRIVQPSGTKNDEDPLHQSLHLQSIWDAALELGGSASSVAQLLNSNPGSEKGGSRIYVKPSIKNEAIRTRMARVKPHSVRTINKQSDTVIGDPNSNEVWGDKNSNEVWGW